MTVSGIPVQWGPCKVTVTLDTLDSCAKQGMVQNQLYAVQYPPNLYRAAKGITPVSYQAPFHFVGKRDQKKWKIWEQELVKKGSRSTSSTTPRARPPRSGAWGRGGNFT